MPFCPECTHASWVPVLKTIDDDTGKECDLTRDEYVEYLKAVGVEMTIGGSIVPDADNVCDS